MPVGPIMMGIGTVPAGVRTQANETFNVFGLTKLFEPLVELYKVLQKDSVQAQSIQQYAFNGTTKISIRGHEPVPFAWYLSVFTALIMFLLIISIAEVFCKKSDVMDEVRFPKEENPPPPPPYDLFAPPPYDSVATPNDSRKRKVIEVYVVPIETSATPHDPSSSSIKC